MKYSRTVVLQIHAKKWPFTENMGRWKLDGLKCKQVLKSILYLNLWKKRSHNQIEIKRVPEWFMFDFQFTLTFIFEIHILLFTSKSIPFYLQGDSIHHHSKITKTFQNISEIRTCIFKECCAYFQDKKYLFCHYFHRVHVFTCTVVQAYKITLTAHI